MKKLLYLLLSILATPLFLACNSDDDDIDYTEYYGWRDENNAVTDLFASALGSDSANTYFNQYVQSLKEPQYYPSFLHYVHRANLDSLAALNPRKDYRPYSTSTLSVHYTLFQTDSLYATVKRQGGWSKEYLRNPGGILDSLFFANAVGPCACLAFRRSQLQPFCDELRWLVDVEWYYRMLASRRVVYDPQLVVRSIHGHEGQITANLDIRSTFAADCPVVARRHPELSVRLMLWLYKAVVINAKSTK